MTGHDHTPRAGRQPAANCVATHRKDPERARRAQPGQLLCAGCYNDLEQALAEMAYLHDSLATRLGRTWRGQTADDGHERVALAIAEKPLPITPVVADHREHMRRTCTSWAMVVAEESGTGLPASPRLDVVAAWLYARLPWCATQPWVDDYAGEVRRLASRARSIIAANPRRRVVVGACPEPDPDGRDCVGTLTARIAERDDLLPSAIVCDVDEQHTWPADQWRTLSVRLTGHRPLDRHAVGQLLDALAQCRGA